MPKKPVKKKWSEKEIQRYVKKWQPRLGLRHWKIETRVVPDGEMDNEDAILEVERHDNAHHAVVMIAQSVTTGDFEANETIDDDFMEISVAHELCHCVVRDLTFVVRDDLKDLLGQVVHELTMRNIYRHEEQVCEALSSSLVRNWPK